MSQKHVKIYQKSIVISLQSHNIPQSGYFIVYNTYSCMSNYFGDVSLCFGRVRSFQVFTCSYVLVCRLLLENKTKCNSGTLQRMHFCIKQCGWLLRACFCDQAHIIWGPYGLFKILCFCCDTKLHRNLL